MHASGAPGAVAPGAVAPGAVAPVDPLLAARSSFQLKNEPLDQLLAILSVTNALRFRYTVVPDATVSVAFKDALLLPALDNMLYAVGFGSVRRERNIWIVSRRLSMPTTTAPVPDKSSPVRGALQSGRKGSAVEATVPLQSWPATWQIWVRSTPPGKGWMAPLALRTPVSSAQRRAGNARSSEVVPLPADPPLSLSGWQTLSLDFAPDPLGVAVRAHQSTLMGALGEAKPAAPATASDASSTQSRSLWLRWPFWLRQLPRGAQLRLHTDYEATLWVNGARVLSRWSGPQLLEVDNLLQTGFNCLAIECKPKPSQTPSAAEPLLRFEWLFAKSSA
ncbi:MAG: hypothetical protein JWN98_2119 [Abditibacteriota bacterium]|nr:hypothetical protein [Abditibacteriota bacterium]